MTELLQLGWDGSSGGTYMWHMIEQDVLERYRPGSGTLRLIVVTDGHDTLSPQVMAEKLSLALPGPSAPGSLPLTLP